MLLFALIEEKYQKLIADLYKTLKPKMETIALSYLHNKEDKEEAVSNAFVKIIDNVEKISQLPCPKIPSYCVTILRNEAINILRKKKPTVSTEEIYNLEDTSYSLEEEVFKNLEVQKLKDLIQLLDEEEKQLLYLRYIEDLPYKKIGNLLNIPENTASKKVQRLIKKLKESYKAGEEIGK